LPWRHVDVSLLEIVPPKQVALLLLIATCQEFAPLS